MNERKNTIPMNSMWSGYFQLDGVDLPVRAGLRVEDRLIRGRGELDGRHFRVKGRRRRERDEATLILTLEGEEKSRLIVRVFTDGPVPGFWGVWDSGLRSGGLHVWPGDFGARADLELAYQRHRHERDALRAQRLQRKRAGERQAEN